MIEQPLGGHGASIAWAARTWSCWRTTGVSASYTTSRITEWANE